MDTSRPKKQRDAAPPPPAKGRLGGVVAAVSVLILSMYAFLPTLQFGLVWDDPMLLAQVGRVAESGGTKALFASDFRLAGDRPLGYYRPVTTSSLWSQVDTAWKAGGADAMPKRARALHATNVLIHMVCSLLVWLLLRRLVDAHAWAAWCGAALFAAHPVHVEPVAFISARTDLLAAMFVLGSILCWVEARARASGMPRTVALVAGALLALAGALAKEQALLLPVVLAVGSALVRKPGRGWWVENRAWLTLWVFAAVLALGMRAQAHVGFGAGGVSIASFIRVGLPALLLYLRLWFIPAPLNSYYTAHELGWMNIVGLLFTAILVVLAARNSRRNEAIAALCLTIVFLLPVLHLVPLGGALAAERFFYLPSVGLAMLTSLALVFFERAQMARLVSRAAVGVAILACMLMCVSAARPWASDKTLFTNMVEVSPHAATAHRGLAEVLMKEGNFAGAATRCREAIRLDPDYADAHELLGVISTHHNDMVTAREEFEAVRRLQPNRASSYTNLGILAFNQGDVAGSLEYFRRAAELDPGSPDVHLNLGNVLLMLGDTAAASKEADILDRLDPARAQALRQAIANPPVSDEQPTSPGGTP